jgi:hypothetical protein
MAQHHLAWDDTTTEWERCSARTRASIDPDLSNDVLKSTANQVPAIGIGVTRAVATEMEKA